MRSFTLHRHRSLDMPSFSLGHFSDIREAIDHARSLDPIERGCRLSVFDSDGLLCMVWEDPRHERKLPVGPGRWMGSYDEPWPFEIEAYGADRCPQFPHPFRQRSIQHRETCVHCLLHRDLSHRLAIRGAFRRSVA